MGRHLHGYTLLIYTYALLVLWSLPFVLGGALLFSSALVIYVAFCASHDFIKCPKPNKHMMEVEVATTNYPSPTPVILRSLMHNLIFDVTYRKLSSGRYLKMPSLTWFLAFRYLFLVVFKVSWFMVVWTHTAVRLARHKDVSSFLFTLTKSSGPGARHIFYTNGVWRLNPDLLGRAYKKILEAMPKLSYAEAKVLSELLSKNWEAHVGANYKEVGIYAKFNDKSTHKAHFLYPEISGKPGVMPHMTSLTPRLEELNYHGKEVMIPRVEARVSSTILASKADEFDLANATGAQYNMACVISSAARYGWAGAHFNIDTAERIRKLQAAQNDYLNDHTFQGLTPEYKTKFYGLMNEGADQAITEAVGEHATRLGPDGGQ